MTKEAPKTKRHILRGGKRTCHLGVLVVAAAAVVVVVGGGVVVAIIVVGGGGGGGGGGFCVLGCCYCLSCCSWC